MKHFTIIILTKDRADTLYWAIKNCLKQDYERMTVFVSDNCSGQETKDVIASFSDQRLVSRTTPAPTSMTGNLDFALGHCLGGDSHLTVIGDDDGLMPGALSYANSILEDQSPSEILTWQTSTYCWPNNLVEAWRNGLSLSVGSSMTRLDSLGMLHKLASCDVYYHHLPGLFTSFVPNQVVGRCLSRTGGRIIGILPDVASAIQIASEVPNYLFTQRSVTLIGSSAHSTGVNAAVGNVEHTSQFFAEATVKYNDRIAPCSSGPVYCAEGLWAAFDAGILPGEVVIDMQKIVRLMLIRTASMTDENYGTVVEAARMTAERNAIPFDFDAWVRQNEAENAGEAIFNDPVIARDRVVYTHRCDPQITANIHDASNLAGELLNTIRVGRLMTPGQVREKMSSLRKKLTSSKHSSKGGGCGDGKARGILKRLRRKIGSKLSNLGSLV